MRLLAFITLITLLTMPSVAYQNHGIAFDIPKNWQLVSDQWINSTQTNGTLLSDAKIELTDGNSTIRIDVVDCPQIAELIGVTGPEPMPMILDKFYQESVLNRETQGIDGRGTLYMIIGSGFITMSWMIVKPLTLRNTLRNAIGNLYIRKMFW